MKTVRTCSTKVRTGCNTCKSRHLKCDETRPVCSKCTRSGFRCIFAQDTKQRSPVRFVHYVTEAPLVPIPSSPERSTETLRGLAFFRLQTAPLLVHPFPADLWSRSLLLLAEHEPAIQHALVAFAFAHEHFVSGAASLPDVSLRLYNESIKLVVRRWSESTSAATEVALASSIVFVCLELLRGCFRSAINIVASANKLLIEIDAGDQSWNESTLPLHEVRWSLFRFTTQIMDVGGFEDDNDHYSCHLGLTSLGRQKFENAESALIAMERIYNQISHLHRRIEGFGPDAHLHRKQWSAVLAQMGRIREDYHCWLAAFHVFCAVERGCSSTPQTFSAIAIIHILRIVVGIMVDLDLINPEDDFDRYIPAFRAIVDGIEHHMNANSPSSFPSQPLFSLATSYVGPLYFVAARCRDSATRHHALRLLKTCNRREGMWDSAIVASIANGLISFEEQTSEQEDVFPQMVSSQRQAASKPEPKLLEDRIKLVMITWEAEEGGRASFSNEYAGSVRAGDRLGGLEFKELVSW